MDGLERMIRQMKTNGEAFSLCWDEDTDLWVCSWTVGNERFSAVNSDPVDAVVDVQRQAG